ncbi:MAG: glutamyl-tRNA reductase [Verrucomicrobiales bacterium]|jgi:glutamyl-tRNA reductase
MELVCYGYNHETASVASREKVSFTEAGLPGALHEMHQLAGVAEAVILSTCNRMEMYAVADDGVSSRTLIGRLWQWLRQRFELSDDDQAAFYHREHQATASHLFAVASGLNSMVLGETEIFGQVKKAYANAQRAGTTGKYLNQLFQRSFQVGKQVRTQTNITRGSTSVGAVGVELAEKIFGDLKKCQILLIGAGEISRRTAQSLQSRGASAVIVSNRSYDKAEILAKEIDGRAIRFDAWDQELAKVDIIISSTSAPHHVVTAETLSKPIRERRGRPLFLIDLSVPRDIDPEVKRFESVYLHDLDALQRLAESGKAKRREQLEVCYLLVDRHVNELFAQAPHYLPAPGSGDVNPSTTS